MFMKFWVQTFPTIGLGSLSILLVGGQIQSVDCYFLWISTCTAWQMLLCRRLSIASLEDSLTACLIRLNYNLYHSQTGYSIPIHLSLCYFSMLGHTNQTYTELHDFAPHFISVHQGKWAVPLQTKTLCLICWSIGPHKCNCMQIKPTIYIYKASWWYDLSAELTFLPWILK